ncbi:MAG: acyl-[acyl-carrier-protein]--UDP-N-acetylglucosamine O-acyltransferase, partial [Bacteroidales bacterium]|nr:acyl-[acyl-carrier-protein]--UDP-N-acetylglucosamine O-acyltransferase [Bacteroidales bacterium]
MINKFTNVHKGAKIADNVIIDSFATIYENVEIGSGTWIGPNVVVMNGARIGKNVQIFPGAVISGDPQDLKFEGEVTTAEIGDNTIIREYVTINKGTKANNKTVVGRDCLIMSYVHIAHDCVLKDRVILGSYAGLAGEVEVGNWAIISPGSLVHQFVRVGT